MSRGGPGLGTIQPSQADYIQCNSGWKLSPVKANKWMEENMFPFYPKGDLKDTI